MFSSCLQTEWIQLLSTKTQKWILLFNDHPLTSCASSYILQHTYAEYPAKQLLGGWKRCKLVGNVEPRRIAHRKMSFESLPWYCYTTTKRNAP